MLSMSVDAPHSTNGETECRSKMDCELTFGLK